MLWKAVRLHANSFITKNGHVGLGSTDLQEGDMVAMLHGGKVPSVLRPKGDQYLLIGACYVHGRMQGEAFEMKSSTVERTFVIV